MKEMTFQFGSADKGIIDSFMVYLNSVGVSAWRDIIPGNPVSGYDDTWYACFKADREQGYALRKVWLKMAA